MCKCNLVGLRQKFGLTQKAAAESIGLDQRQWSRYETGVNEIPLRYVISLCKRWNVTPSFLLGF